MTASAQRPVRLRPALAVLLPALAWVVAAAAAPARAAAQGEGASAATARDAGPQAAPAAADPVVAQVIEMLGARIGEPVIVLWLDKTGSRPRAVAGADLVALHQAGASDDLLKRLVELAAGAPAVAPSPASAAVTVRFAVTYRPVSVEQDDPWAEGWTLYLYLDGRFLAAVERGPLPVALPPRAFERQLAPGKHLLRLTQERRLRYSSIRGYLSPSRVDPSELPFELKPGAPAQVEIRFGERSLRHPGPVAMRVEQDHHEIFRLEPPGANPERWPALCEDVAASLPAGSRLPAAARRDLERCLHWADLWSGIGTAVPPREVVRAESDRGTGGSGAAPR